MGTKLFVGNLKYSMDDKSLETLFAEFGEIVSAKVISDKKTNRSRGFGFVEMASDADADKAVAALNGKEIEGRRLIVDKAKPQKDQRDSYQD